MDNAILFFGAGFYQLPAINLIKKNYSQKLVVLSGVENDPGLKVADVGIVVDILNPDAVEEKVKSLNLKPVAALTVCTDWPLVSIGRINDLYKLRGISEETALKSSNKMLMKNAFLYEDVPAAKFKIVNNYESLIKRIDEFNFPFFLKIPKGGGSKGIIKINNINETDKMKSVFNLNNNTEALVEEALTGVEFGAQAVVEDGILKYCFLHNDTVTDPPVQVPIGHSLPFEFISKSLISNVTKSLMKAIKSLGIKNAICNCDLILEPKENLLKIIEISPRVGATGLSEIIELSYGINLYECAVKIAMNEKISDIDLQAEVTPSAILTIRSNREGLLKDIVCTKDSQITLSVKPERGDRVKVFNTGQDILGFIFCTDESSLSAENRLIKYHENIQLVLE